MILCEFPYTIPIPVLFPVLSFVDVLLVFQSYCWVWVPSRRCWEFVLFVPLYHLKFLYLALTSPSLIYCPEPTTLGTFNTSNCLPGIVRSLCCMLVCVAWPIIHPFISLVSCDTYRVDILNTISVKKFTRLNHHKNVANRWKYNFFRSSHTPHRR